MNGLGRAATNIRMGRRPMDGGRVRKTWLPALAALLVVAGTLAACGDGAVSDSPRDVPQGGTAFDASSDEPSSPTDPSGPTGGDAGADGDADGGPTSNARAVQMQDVTILLPLPKSLAERDSSMLKPSDPGLGGPLFDMDLNTAVGGTDGNGGPWRCFGCDPIHYEDLRLIGLRIDPCFAHMDAFDTGEACENQLRLVFQPVVLKAGSVDSVEAADSGIHLFFSITRAELLDIVSGIIDLRIASGRTDHIGSLAIHPIAESEGLSGAFVRGLYALVTAHAGPGNLIRFARFRTVQSKNWDFSTFDIPGSVPTIKMIPTLHLSESVLGIGDGFSATTLGPHLLGGFNPGSLSDDSLEVLAGYGRAQAATPEARQASYDAALRIEDPRKHTPNTINCTSCHASALLRVGVGREWGLFETGNPNAFQISSPFIPAADMVATTFPDPVTTRPSVHLFSYLFTVPSIAPRVINETALIVDYLNSTAK